MYYYYANQCEIGNQHCQTLRKCRVLQDVRQASTRKLVVEEISILLNLIMVKKNRKNIIIVGIIDHKSALFNKSKISIQESFTNFTLGSGDH